MDSKRKILLTLWMLGLFSFTMLVVPSMNGTATIFSNREFSIKTTDVFVENFDSTTFRDGASTAWGWGTGTVTNSRNFTVTPLDFLETPHDVREIDVQGRKVYAVFYNASNTFNSFGCLDINNPRNIRLLSTRDSFYGMISIAVDGDNLFAGKSATPTSATNQINSYNVSDPFDLGGSGYYLDHVSTDGIVTDIETNGHLIHYTSFNDSSNRSFRMLNAADPDNLVEITPNWDNNHSLGLAVSGHFTYIAASTDGFYILNTTDKHAPLEVGHIALPGNATDVLVNGRIAYVTLREGGIAAINVLNPASPQLLGIYNTVGLANRMALQGNTLFVADGTNGVVVLDVADPTHLSFVTQIALPYTWDVGLYGGDLVVGTDEGIHTFRVGYLGNFAVDWYDTPLAGINARDLRVQGNIAYVAAGEEGLYTINVADPSHPVVMDQYPMPGAPIDALDIYGQFIIAIQESGIYTFDVSNPTDIRLTRTEGATDFEDIAMHGPVAYCAFGDPSIAGIATYNYSDAYGTDFEDNIVFGTNISTIAVQGTYVYAAENLGGGAGASPLTYYTVPDVFDPTPGGSASVYQYGLDLFVDGDLLYMSDEDYFVLFNVTDPTTPTWMGDFNDGLTDIDSYGVWVDGYIVMSASGNQGVYMINSTDYVPVGFNILGPTSNCPNATAATKITANGDYTYVANASSLVILRHFKSAGDTYIPGTTFAQSLEIDTTENIIYHATLDADLYIPADTNIEFFMSADGGANWEPVTLGVEHVFASPGNDLRWRAEIIGAEDRSVHLYEISIDFFFNVQPTTPQIIGSGGLSVVENVQISWNASTDDVGIDRYELQVANEITFATSTTYNTTELMYTVTDLANGIHYFRVRAIDDYDFASDWSATAIIEVAVPLINLPWWAYVAAGGGLVLIILIIVVSVVVSKRKKAGG